MSGQQFHATYRVRFDEAAPSGWLRTSGFLRYAQDVAWQHSEALGFDRAWYGERRLTWLVRAAEIVVAGHPQMGTTLDVSTEVVGYRKVWARRRSEFVDDDGDSYAWAHTDWLLIDAIGRPTRIPDEIAHVLAAPPMTVALARVDLPIAPRDAWQREFRVRRQELDPMAHVNNAVYLDWLEEGIRDAAAAADLDPEWLDEVPRRYRLEYAAAAEPGAELQSLTWRDGPSWAHVVRNGRLELLRARVDAEGRG